MKFTRHYSDGTPVETQIRWARFDSKITAADDSIVFEMKNVEAPRWWSQGAVDILAQKYFRKAGIPSDFVQEPEHDVPEFLERCTPYPQGNIIGSENSARQVFHRLAGCWTYWGWKSKLFSSEEDARIFYDETYLMLARQIAAPNSPQFFNCFSGKETFISREYGVASFEATVGKAVIVWTRQGWASAQVICFGEQNVQTIELAPAFQLHNGAWSTGKGKKRVEITVTPNHRWITGRGETTKLIVGDTIPTSLVQANIESPEYRYGFQHGVIFGDGTFHYMSNDETGLRRFFVRLVGERKRGLATMFDQVSNPPFLKGDLHAVVEAYDDLKDFPAEGSSIDYMSGFMAGWVATDGDAGRKNADGERLRSQHPRSKEWVEKYAALCGWHLSGWAEENTPTNFGERSNPLQTFNITRTPRMWKVMEIIDSNIVEPVYCLVVPSVGEFTLGDGILTGNCGIHWAYGIAGPDCGQWAVNDDGVPFLTGDSYSRPQLHACYIQPLADDLVNPGGIMDLALREAKVFKHGSGSGSNVSNIRATGEKLSGGGTSSGLISFLRVLDRAAGAIKSGGTTRRAALMRILNLDHPEIEAFIDWKRSEEDKARALVAIGYSEAEALETVSGQNANNSVRVTDHFLKCLDEGATWFLTERITGKTVKTVLASELWQKICYAAWASGDPGVQFHDTINAWATCAADGEIDASNPCSEYLHNSNTACNLASLNLVKFLDSQGSFDTRAFEHAVRIWTAVLDISVTMASYPSREIAEGTWKYRTLGLGYANLGGLLMRKGIPYDSAEGRRIAAQIIARLQYTAYITSAEMAIELGAFPRYEENKNHISNVLAKHDAASRGVIGARYAVDAKVRNAQVSVTAPTGTIALLMDCDTTGIEPDFSLVKLKKLAGGGEMRIVNQSVPIGLKSLGYTTTQIAAILAHIEKTGTVLGMAPRNGDPFIAPEHIPVFATAVGENSISPEAHVRMVAAVQPFISGGISKTVNMPNSATVEDVDKIYRLAHELGCKSIAIYRDGCKLSQPLSEGVQKPDTDSSFLTKTGIHILSEPDDNDLPTSAEKSEFKPTRRRLPKRRFGYTNEYVVDGQKLFLRTGEYDDGTLGEVFVNLSKEGSTARALMEAWAKAVSLGLQFGVPLEKFVNSFTHIRFEPAGIVSGHDQIKMCSSLIDLVMRDLGISYLNRNDLGHTMPVEWQQTAGVQQGALSGINILSGSGVAFTAPDLCWECGQPTLIRTGTCLECTNCHANTGCG